MGDIICAAARITKPPAEADQRKGKPPLHMVCVKEGNMNDAGDRDKTVEKVFHAP